MIVTMRSLLYGPSGLAIGIEYKDENISTIINHEFPSDLTVEGLVAAVIAQAHSLTISMNAAKLLTVYTNKNYTYDDVAGTLTPV